MSRVTRVDSVVPDPTMRLFGRTAVRFPGCLLILLLLTFSLACGNSKNSATTSGMLTGNWEITLNRHASTIPLTFSGFMVQSGNAVTGSMVLGDGCKGVGPVNGTLDSQKLSLTINEFGQDLSLEGPLPAGVLALLAKHAWDKNYYS